MLSTPPRRWNNNIVVVPAGSVGALSSSIFIQDNKAMKENISTQPISNEVDGHGQNVLDKQTRCHFSHHAIKRYPLIPTWRVYRISYWLTSQSSYLDKKYVAKKGVAVK